MDVLLLLLHVALIQKKACFFKNVCLEVKIVNDKRAGIDETYSTESLRSIEILESKNMYVRPYRERTQRTENESQPFKLRALCDMCGSLSLT
jgi:hypothetical protein